MGGGPSGGVNGGDGGGLGGGNGLGGGGLNGGIGGDGWYTRMPQSMQSWPKAQADVYEPCDPSSQMPSPAWLLTNDSQEGLSHWQLFEHTLMGR